MEKGQNNIFTQIITGKKSIPTFKNIRNVFEINVNLEKL